MSKSEGMPHQQRTHQQTLDLPVDGSSENQTLIRPPESGVEVEAQLAEKSMVDRARQNFCAVAGMLRDDATLGGQIHEVLRLRLRAAAILLGSGYLAFFLLALWFGRIYATPTEPYFFGAHLVMVFVCGLVAQRLCSRCRHFEHHLRLVEAALFGGSALMFLVYSVMQVEHAIAKTFPPLIAPPWMLLIFMYALLVPNTWKRALVITGVFGLLPIVVLFAFINIEGFKAAAAAEGSVAVIMSRHVLMLMLSISTAVWGVAVTRHLRTQVHEARQLGQYQLRKLLGEGGMGAVYVAEHVMLKRPCAIKLIRPGKAHDAQAMARFEREVRSTAQLVHWNIVEIYDFGETEDGTFYYVMEYLPGLNLDELVEVAGPLPTARAIHLLSQTSAALAEAHAAGMIHRDIKPANVYAANRGRRFDVAKLLDFGLVATAETAHDDLALTREGSITGSPSFMSPEQAMGEKPDERSDIYSLGAVAYFLVTGKAPFERNTMMKTIMAHVQDEVVPPSRLETAVDSDFEAVILKCLEKKPSSRFQTAEELQAAIDCCQGASDWSWQISAQWWEACTAYKKRELDQQVLMAG